MALFSKTEEEQAAKEIARAAKLAEKYKEEAEQEQQKVAAAFAKSPVGKARQAYADGDAFFQIEIDHAQMKGVVSSIFGSMTAQNKRSGATDTLGAIQAEGWKLHTANHVYVMTGQNSRDKLMTSQTQTAVSGRVVGIFLFERNEVAQ